MLRQIYIVFIFIFFSFTAFSQQNNSGDKLPPYLYVENSWVDSVLNTMTPDERIGQLFMVAAWSKNGPAELERIANLIRKQHIGGIIMMQGGPVREAAFINFSQSISNVPLLISQDAEWGLSMRLDSTIVFPRQGMLGAMQDDSLVYKFGKEMARECTRIGVNVSFSPVVDINNNPLNPVIGDRSFGEDKFNVAAKGIAYMKGLQDGGVLACAKHFPGHGNADKDSHKTLPVINGSKKELDSLELFPFRKIFSEGVGSVMVAHLSIPALDSTSNAASSLSSRIVTGLLRNDLGFKGLAFTDALNMAGVGNYPEPGMVDLKALLAGNDILLFSGDVAAAINQIKTAIKKGKVDQSEIDIRVRKILQAKFWLGLSERKPVDMHNLYEDLNSGEAVYLKQRLIGNSLTLVHNKDGFLPVKDLTAQTFASVSIGSDSITPFQHMISNYAMVQHFNISKDAKEAEFNDLEKKLQNYSIVFIALQNMLRSPEKQFGITPNSINFINRMSFQHKVILTVFGNPYALQNFSSQDWLLEAYNDEPLTQSLAAQLLFGGIEANGKLPVSASLNIRAGEGMVSKTIGRLQYTLPEDAGISSYKLKKIDSLVQEGITQHAIPGCQVFISKDSKVLLQKSFGNFTYDVNESVANDDLYDLASITKVAATTLMLMKLYDEKKLNLSAKACHYLPDLKRTNKENITIKQLLLHEGGLVASIPFYKKTIDSAGYLSGIIYRNQIEDPYTVMVTPSLYMNHFYLDTLWKEILESPVEAPGKYVYSDLDFIILKKIAEKISGETLNNFVTNNFYRPLGLSTIGFNPLSYFPKERIVPSNYDSSFRKQLIQGTVHDPAAAMLGGIGGHAGLFSDANDVGILMQMLLNYGEYAGVRYLDSATVVRFTSRNSEHSRRGFGFDKPETEPDKPSPVCDSASALTFGHQGFTGTCVWADPKYQLIFVFLSNRTFPDEENKELLNLNIRGRIEEVIYDLMQNKSPF